MSKSKDTYTCAECGGEFEKGWSDEEAKAEFGAEFTSHDLDDAALVCDDCYKKIMAGIRQ